MKTDELVKMLATSAGPVDPKAPERSYATALGWGTCGALLIMEIKLGVRPDIYAASFLPMFWMKIIFPLAAAATALSAVLRLGRPGMSIGKAPAVFAGLLFIVWAAGALTLLQAPPEQRDYLIYGQSWKVCPYYIALISIPVFVAGMWVMKGMAPTRPVLAGSATGLLAGAIAVAVYALHCPEMEAPFLAIWYVLGMFIPVGVGALIGSRFLRW